MRLPALVRSALATGVAAGLLALIPSGATAAVSASTLRCTGATDVAGIDALLQEVGSPLAGHAAAFVREGTRAGIDPRFLVAVAAHETLLETYAPALAIHNPFGLGPGWSFDDEDDAIATAARTLARYYLPEGRDTIEEIGAKWAPVGADNDPGALNGYWPGGVGAYYRALGGDPGRPILLAGQQAAPACAPIGLAPVSAAAGPAVVTVWGGRAPAIAEPGMHAGGDPRTGLPAVIERFHFPVAPPDGVTVRYADTFADQGPGLPCYGRGWRCTVTLATSPGVLAVAPVDGRLAAASADQQAAGVGFWIDTGRGDRVGYGALADYAEGVREGAQVAAGQVLGHSTGSLTVAWTRGGMPVNPFPLLSATRPSDP